MFAHWNQLDQKRKSIEELRQNFQAHQYSDIQNLRGIIPVIIL
jgi:hypothetical protein